MSDDRTSLHRREDGSYVVRGELSYATVTPLLKHSDDLFADASDALVVDLDGVTRADSAGLSLLIEWWRQARAHDKTIEYTNLPEQILATARLGGLDELLPLK
ncbi:MAG: STAS domain-containing protein [Gammaproteobacteria bacterium]|nr:STAS domain-containing protein [Gammaproteobacteria bacterium]